MSQRIALWTSAALSVAFALIVSVVLVGPSISAQDPVADTRYVTQSTDAIDRGDWAQLDWFGQPVSDQQSTMWQSASTDGQMVATSYTDDDYDTKDTKHDDEKKNKDKKHDDKKDKDKKHDSHDKSDKHDDHDEDDHD